jgi:CBS domain-containing membrane protein
MVLPVVDAERRLLGMLSLEELHLATQSTNARSLVLTADLMREGITPLRPGDRLDRALELFVEHDLLALPVVDDGQRVIGLVRRYDVASAYLRHVHGPAQSVVDSPSLS